MAFRAGKSARVYIDYLHASAYARSVDIGSSTDMHDVTVLTDDDKNFVVGQATGSFSINGPLDVDGSSESQFDSLADQLGATDATVVTYLPLGGAAADDYSCWLIETHHTQLSTSAGVGQSVDWALTGQPTGEVDFQGVILENNTTVTTDTNGTAHTGPSGGTSDGAVFHLHVTAFSGFTSDAIIVEGSTSGSFAGEETTIATFTSVTGLTSERVEVTGTVPRYLRVVDDVTGTGSITRLVAVSRR